MAWTEHCVETWTDFNNKVLEPYVAATQPLDATFIFRGHSSSNWTLEPSLTRICKSLNFNREQTLKVEQRLLLRFKERAHLHLDPRFLPTGFGTLLTPDTSFEWWTLIQHYRGPTRLLDWTQSPLVALYFAVRSQWDVDGAIWCLHGVQLNLRGNERYGTPEKDESKLWRNENPKSRVWVRNRHRPTDRMLAQQGTFTVSEDITLDHADAAEDILPENDGGNVLRYKYLIPADSKRDFLRQLHHMNVGAGTLFPGLDGLGAEMEELIRFNDEYAKFGF